MNRYGTAAPYSECEASVDVGDREANIVGGRILIVLAASMYSKNEHFKFTKKIKDAKNIYGQNHKKN